MDRKALKYENRRSRLKSLIEKLAQGNQSAFGRKYGYSRSQIGQFLSNTYNDGRSIGGNVADALEEKCELPIGWFDWVDETPTSWPFVALDPKQYWDLSSAQRQEIEKQVIAQVGQYLGTATPPISNLSPTVRKVLAADSSSLSSTPKKRKEKDSA